MSKKRRAGRPARQITSKRKTIRLGEIAGQFDSEVWKARGMAEQSGDGSFSLGLDMQDEMIEILMGVLARHIGKKIAQHGSRKVEALTHVCYPIPGEEHLMEFWHRPQWHKSTKKDGISNKADQVVQTEEDTRNTQ